MAKFQKSWKDSGTREKEMDVDGLIKRKAKCSFTAFLKLSIWALQVDGQIRTLSFWASVSKRTQKWVAVFLLRFQSPLCDLLLNFSSIYLTQACNMRIEVTRSWGREALNWRGHRLKYSPFSLFNVGQKKKKRATPILNIQCRVCRRWV